MILAQRARGESDAILPVTALPKCGNIACVVTYGAAIIERFTRKYADARRPAARLLTLANAASWGTFTDLRRTFPSADLEKRTGLVIFDIGVNKCRLLASVDYESQEIDIRSMLTHAECEREKAL